MSRNRGVIAPLRVQSAIAWGSAREAPGAYAGGLGIGGPARSRPQPCGEMQLRLCAVAAFFGVMSTTARPVKMRWMQGAGAPRRRGGGRR